MPDDLRALVGKTEEKLSLRTRDPSEAKRKLAAVLIELEARWVTLRKGPTKLSEREAHELAVPFCEACVEEFRDNPSNRPVEKTAYSWSRVMDEIKAFVGHDNAQSLTADEVEDFAGGRRP